MASRFPTTLCSLVVILAVGIASAEEPVRSTQEELRRRNLYFGDIDGRRSPEYEEAVKKYQRRKGFGASGHEDPDTLRSLGLLARNPNEAAPKELEWPQETVLKSDTKVDVVGDAKELAATTGIAPESVLPTIAQLSPSERAKLMTKRRRTGFGLPASTRARTGAGAGAGTAAAGGSSEESGRGSGPIAIAQVVGEREIMSLIDSYLKAVTRGHLKDELSFYADHVDYYGNGMVDRRIIELQLRRYYAQWPSRSYRLAGVASYRRMPKTGEIAVTFTVNFTLKNHRTRVKGVTENRVVINAATSSPRIVAIQERRLRQ